MANLPLNSKDRFCSSPLSEFAPLTGASIALLVFYSSLDAVDLFL